MNRTLLDLLGRASAILGEELVGMYLYGSLAAGGFELTFLLARSRVQSLTTLGRLAAGNRRRPMMAGTDYFERFDEADALYDAGEYAAAIALLEPALEEFPERYFHTAFFTMVCYRALGQFDCCFEVIERGVEQGYFFPLQGQFREIIAGMEGGETLLAENDRLKAEAQKVARMRYEVHLPDGYTPEKRYPTFLTMHCDGGHIGNIEGHRRFWLPDALLERGMIVVYLQSSQVLCFNGYGWSGDAERRRQDIRQCYDEVVGRYAVDTEKVIVSGFSGGAMAAIDVALNAIAPVRGFIALCPDKPEEFARERCDRARQSGVRGVIMEGELSGGVPDLQEMEAVFTEVGLPYKLIINEGVGHWYPGDLTAKVVESVVFITSE